MDIKIRLIEKNDYHQAHKLQCEYLDEEVFENFVARIKHNPDLYFCALDKEKIIGVCYGQPSHRINDAIQLQGIAINLGEDKKYSRKGIGTSMLSIFENAAKIKGYKKIDLGCADDEKVEKFYLKNGYHPYEIQAKGNNHFLFEKQSVSNYTSALNKKKILRKKYNPKEVILIMQKEHKEIFENE